MNKTELLNRLAGDPEERLLLARAMDRLDLAQSRGIPAHTPFLNLAEQDAVARLLAAVGRPAHLFWGGYPDAERKVCAFLPDWMEGETFQTGEDCPLTALRLTVPPGTALSHRDYLGSILGLGITREKVGDLLVEEGGCQVLLLREVERILLTQLDRVGRVGVKLSPCGLEGLAPPEKKVRLIRDTVATLRLDAVAAAGFSTSRSKMAGHISSGKLTLNGRVCDRPDRTVEEGAVLACRGLGKCALREVSGPTKKGRTMILMERYL